MAGEVKGQTALHAGKMMIWELSAEQTAQEEEGTRKSCAIGLFSTAVTCVYQKHARRDGTRREKTRCDEKRLKIDKILLQEQAAFVKRHHRSS